MKIRIVCVGKMKEEYFLKAQKEYAKRLSRFASLEIVELADERTPDRPTEREKQSVLKKEGERVLKAVEGFDIVSVLAVEAEQMDSEGFAAKLGEKEALGKSVCYVIGGSLGLAEEVKRQAQEKFSLSRLTFPHRLARIVLLEQLYRGFKICHGQTYHK